MTTPRTNTIGETLSKHDEHEDCPPVGKLPAPRLQLRWEATGDDQRYEWQCHYELVLPLGEYDIRREVYREDSDDDEEVGYVDELVVAMNTPTLRGGNHTPCTSMQGERYYDAPYRDGAHASWDAAVLGNLPIYVVAPDGTHFSKTDDEEKRARTTGAQP